MQNPINVVQFFDTYSPVNNAAFLYILVLKVLFLLAFFLYCIFAVLIVRQVTLMDQTIKTPLALILKLIAWIHFFLVILLFVFAFFVL